ncbi:MAG: glycosyltransferase family 2 protein [Myxococcales bacterium]|nr:glycosyltransferase family 2 protein [Myxococcales bacterium]
MSRSGRVARVGVVLIGRNEGARLVRSLESVCDGRRPVIYVDSGSTDDSVAEAQARGALVVALDMSRPFSAARARNAGWRALLAAHPDLDAVQFVDGDCEVAEDWLTSGAAALAEDDTVVAVMGYRRERYPEASVYNRVCDVEWRSGPAGDVRCFGGDVMIRATALQAVGGYDPSVIAAEDDELGVRLRAATGGRFVRLAQDTTLHDADMHHASQWWQRAKRCGHGYAQVNHLHGAPPERYFEAQLRRSLLWGLVVPAGALLLAPPTLGLSLGLFARYPLVAVRAALRTRRQGFPVSHALAWGGSVALAPFPEAQGALKFHRDRARRAAPEIIEYKS